MKSLRFVSALLFLASLPFSASFGADKGTSSNGKSSACECPVDKDGKKCGVDKECCCEGKKEEKKPSKYGKKVEKKPEPKKTEAQK